MKRKTAVIAAIFFIILSLIFIAFWANTKLREQKGVTNLAEGMQGTLYVIIEDYLLKVSHEGKLLNKMHLKDDLGISDRITDIVSKNDGTFLIGLLDSHQIRMYSSDGRIIRTCDVEPTSFDFMMALNSSNDFLYVSFYRPLMGSIQVFGSDLHKISSISWFINPDKPQRQYDDLANEEDTDTDAIPNYYDHFEPADIFYYDDRLHIADAGRIVILKPDGTLSRIIPLPSENVSAGMSFVRTARMENMLYGIMWDYEHNRGAITAIDLITDRKVLIGEIRKKDASRLLLKGYYHLPDIVVRKGDILVADQNASKVRRFATEGGSIGFFGDDSLLRTMGKIEKPYKIYKLVRWGSIIGAILALIAFVFIYKNLKSIPVGSNVLLTSITAGRILGTEGHWRRKFLLIAVPGLGQLAAGRKLRAILFIVPFLISLSWFLSSLWALIQGDYYFFYYAIYSGSLLLLVWIATARDALSLSKYGTTPWNFNVRSTLTTLLVPLIPVSIGTAAQILWEISIRANPQPSFIVQGILREVLLNLKIAGELSPFDVLLSANTIISWSLALGAMFACIAWQTGSRTFTTLLMGIFGFLIGIVSIILFTIIATTYAVGSGFYTPLFWGLFIGIVQFLAFFRKRISPWVIVAAIAGAGLANVVDILGTSNLILGILGIASSQNSYNLSFLLGAMARTSHVVVNIYFLSLAAFFVVVVMKPPVIAEEGKGL